MASAATPAFPSTKETTNYARLCRLLVDVGSQALRDTFDAIHPAGGLHIVFGASPRACNTKISKEQESLESYAMGEAVSNYSIICFICRV